MLVKAREADGKYTFLLWNTQKMTSEWIEATEKVHLMLKVQPPQEN